MYVSAFPSEGTLLIMAVVVVVVTEGENSFLHILYGNLDQTTFYAANVLVSEKTRKSLNGNPPFGLLLGESYVTPARHYCTMACGSVGQQE